MTLPPSLPRLPAGTCSDGAHHGLHGEVEGVVPGADDEDHAQRLRVDVALILLGLGRLLRGLVQNPLGELLDYVLDLLQAVNQLLVVRVPLVLRGEAPVSAQPRALSGLPGAVGPGSTDLLPFPNPSPNLQKRSMICTPRPVPLAGRWGPFTTRLRGARERWVCESPSAGVGTGVSA